MANSRLQKKKGC